MGRWILCLAFLAVVCALPGTLDAQGNALSFDGDGDHVDMTLPIGNPAQGTIMVWIFAESYDTGYNMLNLLLAQNDNIQLGLGDSSLSADGHWIFRLNDGGGMKNAVGPLVTLDRWTHIAATWDSTDIVLYLDGTEVARVPAGSPNTANGGVRLGAHSHASQNYWDGLIDEVSVWTIALTQSQIRTRRVSSLGPDLYDDPSSGLVTYLPCDEAPGSTVVNDLTTFANHGTLAGNTDFVIGGAPLAFFADGFETGDYSAWGDAEP